MKERSRELALDSAAEALPCALFLLDEPRRVLRANALAQELSAGPGPSCVIDDRLVGRDLSGRRCLRRLRVAAAAGRLVVDACGGFRVSLVPLPRDPFDLFGYTRGIVMLRVSGTAIDAIARRAYLRSRFSATAAEASVAELIAQGHAWNTSNVHAGHVEVSRSLQHVAVVRIHLVKAMLLGAGQV